MDKETKPSGPNQFLEELATNFSGESSAYLHGLYQELQQQTAKYAALTSELLSLEARVELAEKTVCLTRDHLALEIEQSDSAAPRNWSETLNRFRFAGVRLADACLALLKERRSMTPQQLLVGLNEGMFRFRTSAPLREIHAALLRQESAKKEDANWVWIGQVFQVAPTR